MTEDLGADEQDVRKWIRGVGTPDYMAPEHFQGKTDRRSDVYQFGLIAGELLQGRFPLPIPNDRYWILPIQWSKIAYYPYTLQRPSLIR